MTSTVLAIFFPTFSCLLYLQVKHWVWNSGSNENLEKVAWLTNYYIIMSTIAKIKIAMAPMNQALWMMELTLSKGSGQTVFLVTVAILLPKGHDLKAMVDVQKVFVKSMKNVLTSYAHLTCCYSLLNSVTGIGNATEKTPPEQILQPKLVEYCCVRWFGSIQFQGFI